MTATVLATACARHDDVRRIFGASLPAMPDTWKLNGSLFLQPRTLAAMHSPYIWCEWTFTGPATAEQETAARALAQALSGSLQTLIRLPDSEEHRVVWPTWVDQMPTNLTAPWGAWWAARGGELICAIGEEAFAWALPLVIEPARFRPR